MTVLSTGCVPSRLAANQIITAPNQHESARRLRSWSPVWTNFVAHLATNTLVPLTIPVGPPEATLKVMEVPPADYHVKFTAEIEERPDGGRHLSLALLSEPANTFQSLPTPATILVLHGYGLMKETMAPWAFVLAQAGYRVIVVDLRGHGESTGTRIGFGKYETADLSQVLDYLLARGQCDERVGVLGLSYGATLALQWAARDPRVCAVVAIAPYNQPEEAILRFADMARVSIGRKTIREAMNVASAKLQLQWSDWSGEAAMRHIRQPVLLIGGEQDPVSRPADIATLQQAAAGETASILLADANHYEIGLRIEELTKPIRDWFHEHLETSESVAGGR